MKKLFWFARTVMGAALILQLSEFSSPSYGAAGDVDLSFNAGHGASGPVQVVAVQPDGKVLIGSPLTFINGTNCYGSARLNPDGSPDSTFVPGIFNAVVGDLGVPHDPASVSDSVTFTALAVQPDGKVLVAGVATRWHCTEELGCINPDYFFFVTRHHTDGSRDTHFAPALGLRIYGGGETVRTLTVQPDGKVVLLGNFQVINGTNRNGIARLNANGSLDTSFNPGFGVARTIGHPRYNMQEIDYATTVTTQPDGKLLFGVRTEYSQCDVFEGGCIFSSTYSVVRFNAHGSKDSGFVFTNVINNTALLGQVSAIAVQPDGKIVVGSSAYNTVAIGRLNANGSWDDSFTRNTIPNRGIDAVALQPDGKVLIAGAFTTVNGTNRNRVARLNANGGLDDSFDPEPPLGSAPTTLALQADGKVLIGGPPVVGVPWFGPLSDEFTFVNGANQHGRMRLNGNGRVDRGFVSSPFNPPLTAFYHPEDCLGNPRYGCYQGVVTTAHRVQADGRVLISGYSVTTITGDETFVQIHHPFLGRFNASGGLEGQFNHLTNAYEMNALAVQPDGKILVGGWFYQSSSNYGVARLQADGSVDSSLQLNQGPSFNYGDGVTCLALQADGKILMGGRFGLARLNSNGTREAGFNPALLNGAVHSIAVQPDGRILAGGSFTTVNGVGRNGIARIHPDGSLDAGFNPGSGVNAPIYSLVLQPDGNILIGGAFSTVNGLPRLFVARLYGADVGPSLKITRSSGAAIVSWPVPATGFVLEQSLTTTGVWSQVAFPYSTNANVISISAPANSGNKFYRLRNP